MVRRSKNNEGVGRWNCRKCLSAFKVTSGTIFQGTKVSPAKVVRGYRHPAERHEACIKPSTGA